MPNEATDIKFILRDPIRLAEVLETAAKSAEKLDTATRNAGNSAGKVVGPYTRLEQRVRQLTSGIAPGNRSTPSEIADLFYNARSAQGRVRRLETPRPGFVRSTLSRMSRVPMDLSGAVNAGLSAVGAAGPEGKAIELLGNTAIEAVGKIREMADSAAASGKRMTELRVATGATNAEAAMLGGLGANAGDATGVRSRALSDPYAYAQAQQAGVSFMPGPMGEANSGRDLIRLLSNIRQQSEAQQRISLRTLGLEGFAGLMKVSNQTFEQIRSDSRLTAQLLNDGFQRSSAEYDASKQRVETAKGNLNATVGKPFMEDLTNINNSGSDFMNRFARGAALRPDAAKGLVRSMEFLIPPLAIASILAERDQKNKRSAAGDKPEDKIAGSTDRLTRAMERLAAGGNVGTGERFNAAIPAALHSGQYLAMAVAHHELAAMSLN